MQTIHLTQDDQAHIETCAAPAMRMFDTTTEEGCQSMGLYGATHTPLDAPLRRMVQQCDPHDALFVDGLPTLPMLSDRSRAAFLVALFAAFMRAGAIWNWQGQSDEAVQTIAPMPDAPANTNATAKTFGGHADDNVMLGLRPQRIFLVGLLNTARTRTGWVSGRRLLEGLPEAWLHRLSNSHWMLRGSAALGLGTPWLGPVPVVRWHGAEAEVFYSTYGVRPRDGKSGADAAVIDWLNAMVEERMQWCHLDRGTMLILPQRFGLHARDEIDGDRLAFRAYVNDDLSVHRAVAAVPGRSQLFDARKALDHLWRSKS